MGFDANKKSASERQKRLHIFASLLALSGALLIVMLLLKPWSSATPRTRGKAKETETAHRAMANVLAARAKENTGDAAAAGGDDNDAGGEERGGGDDLFDEEEAAAVHADLERQVREIKKTGVIMEADEKSLRLTAKLQEATRTLIGLRYGDIGEKNYRVRLDLEFQPTIPDFAEKGKEGSLVVELAPISLLPCSVYNFLEIARTWKKGAFRRNAGHVLQALARSDITQAMPFQEYNKAYPHKKGTLGYAGRPSGPEFYVSIEDNSVAHGPGSQQTRNKYEADCIIGTVIQGMEDGTVDRIHTMPGKEFLSDEKKWVWIRRMHILVPGDGPDGYVEFSVSPWVISKD